jgi:(2Fe-2S) ferredoxin
LSFYQKHIFVCVNQKAEGKVCCANEGGEAFFVYLKERLTAKGLHGPGKIRVTKSSCLGRCASGPCMVIYPEGTWYRYHSFQDIDAIVEQHLISQKLVATLLLPGGEGAQER